MGRGRKPRPIAQERRSNQDQSCVGRAARTAREELCPPVRELVVIGQMAGDELGDVGEVE